MITFEEIKKDPGIRTYIQKADESLINLGFTEHSIAHVGLVAANSKYILETLGYTPREVELVQIAAYLHDLGTLVNRIAHSQSGAVMAVRLLDHLHMDPVDIAEVVTAIGNHDEGTGTPVSPMAAALILADKSDVRRSRVRNKEHQSFDIHDRVNYAAERSELTLDPERRTLTLSLGINTEFCAVMDYFEIFLERMLLCRRAAEFLELTFKLDINGLSLL